MQNWTIKALYFGETQNDRAKIDNGLDPGTIMVSPYLGFLLQNGKENVLVDTGMHERMLVDGKGWGGNPCNANGKWVLESLEKARLTPKDIDTVIYTHLHNDHAGNAALFPYSRTIFQKDEYANLLDPLPSQRIRRDYDLDVIGDLEKIEKNIMMIDGDFELPNGLKLYKTPGHTLGSMSIVVPTNDGPRIITGDTPHKIYAMFPQMTSNMNVDGSITQLSAAPLTWGRYIANSVIYDHYAYFDSMDRLRLMAPSFEPKYYLAGHEGQLLYDYPNE